MFIGIAGIIGAGKSTLARSLAAHLGCDTYNEPVDDNPYLDDFYDDMNRWGAMMQIHLLFRRFEQHQQIVWKKKKGAVQDRTIYEDTIFARMLHEAGFIDKRDYETYLGHFNIMKRFLVYPDILIYLRVSPETSMQRIQERGRGAENRITLEYMQKLYQGYESFITEMSHYTRTLTVDWNEYMETKEVAEMVKEKSNENREFIRDLK
ncbi:deoxynucleoside kinase [Opitutales bacterium]|nr:deoxynucleoside kinase [Opitutales bacterium]